MKRFILEQIAREEIQTINRYKQLGYNNNNIIYLLEIDNKLNDLILQEGFLDGSIKMIVQLFSKITSLLSSKFKLNNLSFFNSIFYKIKQIISKIKSIGFKKVIMSMILISKFMLLTNTCQAAFLTPKTGDAIKYGHSIAVIAQEISNDNGPDTEELLKHITKIIKTNKDIQHWGGNTRETFKTNWKTDVNIMYNELDKINHQLAEQFLQNADSAKIEIKKIMSSEMGGEDDYQLHNKLINKSIEMGEKILNMSEQQIDNIKNMRMVSNGTDPQNPYLRTHENK